MFRRLRGAIRQRTQAWIARRSPRQRGPISLHRRRIYIMPTRAGAAYGALVFVMLLGAMNYSNSLAFVLTFLLAGVGLVCMHHTHRNLVNLRLDTRRHAAVFAGGDAVFRLRLHNPSASDRFTLRYAPADDAAQAQLVDLPARADADLQLSLPATHRGWLDLPRLRIDTVYPMGLFRAWAWARLESQCLIYPRPAGDARLPHSVAGDAHGNAALHAGLEDFTGLRRYTYGDPPRRIDWKAYPRSGQVMVKQFADPRERELWLDWAQTRAGNTETRLSQLARWVLTAERLGQHYGLRLPDGDLPPAHGSGHRDRCLRRLALYRLEQTPA